MENYLFTWQKHTTMTDAMCIFRYMKLKTWYNFFMVILPFTMIFTMKYYRYCFKCREYNNPLGIHYLAWEIKHYKCNWIPPLLISQFLFPMDPKVITILNLVLFIHMGCIIKVTLSGQDKRASFLWIYRANCSLWISGVAQSNDIRIRYFFSIKSKEGKICHFKANPTVKCNAL